MEDKLISVGKGALIAAGGALLAYLSAFAAKGDADLGVWGPVVVAACSVALNCLRKLSEGNKPSDGTPTPALAG